jgi:2-dehydro-3-deoxyphosphogluconate aldolase / (4S)-4-hydroxy-2-oxoglutarate aldolase
MPRFTRMQTLNAMFDSGLVPVFYHADPEIVINVAKACAKGGSRVFEFTNRGDNAHEVFNALEKFCAKELPQIITGVGSIVDSATAALYLNSGANFVVSPATIVEVARLCNRRKVAYLPGCATVTEISAAEELGCEIVKIFPGQEVGGPSFVKAIKGPCPWVSIMPTGGVEPTETSLSQWFQAGIVCAGIGSNLITKDLLAKKDYDGIAARVAQTIETIAKVRPQPKK